ncbi:tRNAHis guanylyltransferase [Drechmeria coniospora]|uniref:tRNA(His) guanylyltransferase n=1 Tax=Drechmeria coniospora TaxID=98403 RepID=A0A151GC63_DRECN|nr:tRNAHis guanylyltransferase [Drechmeria coniospora]KYK54644.1 tRNAHis guanylyltransferase [Drechmeria coniospora]
MCAKYEFEKPNDQRALDLMNIAAKAVVADLPEIMIAYGVSDEYSRVPCSNGGQGSSSRADQDNLLLMPSSSKLVSTIVSTFTANYVYSWPTAFPDTPLSFPLPTFDGRAVCYPSVQNLRDYLSWRQADCHINNLYNTTFWALIQLGGLDNKEAEKSLAGTLAADKNEILFSRFGTNYNNEPEMFRKGSVIFRDFELAEPDGHNVAQEMEDLAMPIEGSKSRADKERKRRTKARVVVEHLDIIKDDFWNRRPWILSGKPGKVPKET